MRGQYVAASGIWPWGCPMCGLPPMLLIRLQTIVQELDASTWHGSISPGPIDLFAPK